MKTQLFNSIKRSVKYWWVSLLIGILAIIVGIWCLATPDSTLVALTLLFVISFFISGISDIVFAISNRDAIPGWGWTLTSGILEVLLGCLLLAMPLPSITVVLIYFVGFWVLFRSIWAIGEACHLQQLGVKGWGWLLALAILAVLFSFLYLLSPIFGGVFVIVLVSLGFVTYGAFRVLLAFRMRSINKELKEIE